MLGEPRGAETTPRRGWHGTIGAVPAKTLLTSRAMEDDSLARLRGLLRGTRVATLALLVDDEPVAGLLPFLAAEDLSRIFVHVSTLARHTRGLAPGARFSAVLHQPDRSELDPLRLPRLLAEGRVEALEDEALERVRAAWVAAFPSAAMTVGLGDFSFRALRIESGRLVSGFAQAESVGPDELARAAAFAG